jgi:DNA-binding MarR family transcriptional regulator
MGKRSKEKVSKKERRRAEAAALARSSWLSQATGLNEAEVIDRPARPTGLAIGVPVTMTADAAVWTDVAMEANAADTEAARAAQDPTSVAALAARLASLSTVLQREMGRADVGDGLTRARLSALSLLVLGGPRTLGELAAAEHVRPPTMTRLVHAMEADGLVARQRHPTDGRSIVIRATSAGEQLLETGRARQLAPLATAIAGLASPERARLEDAADLLGRVLRAVGRGSGDRPT